MTEKMMFQSIIFFYIVMITYHVIGIVALHTLGYEYITNISIARDIGWVLIVLGGATYHYKQIVPFLQRRKYVVGGALATIFFSIIVSRIQGVGLYNIFIGIKYGFMFLRILLSSLFIGQLLSDKQVQYIQKRLPRIIGFVIVSGLIWQAAKYIWPDFFSHIGYGPIGDFIFGQEPPIYYRTGPGGEPRLQGLFAGPNNYGYFLAAFFPMLLMRKEKIQKKNDKLLRYALIILIIASVILTLSRTAFIGVILGTILLYRTQIKKHRNILVGIIIVAIVSIIGLSILKGGSTQEHLINKWSSIQYVIQKPRGYGLGTSGPAIHHQGSILPENYYLQMAIDTGTLGCILLLGTLIMLIGAIKRQTINKEIQAMTIGFYVLLVMGLFLHVFEDSMVNYLFFIPRGIYLGRQNKKMTNSSNMSL